MIIPNVGVLFHICGMFKRVVLKLFCWGGGSVKLTACYSLPWGIVAHEIFKLAKLWDDYSEVKHNFLQA
jgi:hypothetical protein